MTAVIARLSGVSRRFDATYALTDANLALRAGEFVALVGRSGSGKSTALNILGLLDVASSGTYELLGTDVSTLTAGQRAATRAHRLGFVFQAFHLLEHRTVTENVELGAVYLGWPRSRRRDRARQLVDQLGLGERRDRRPNTLSGGERQRVAIARALMGEPELVLCDEPTGNLDTENAAAVSTLLRSVNAAGTTILMVTHDPDLAATADRVVRITDGVLREA